MYSFVKRNETKQAYGEKLAQLGFPDILDPQRPWQENLSFYPAFGGDATRQIKDVIIREVDTVKAVNATWWYDCREVDGHLVAGA